MKYTPIFSLCISVSVTLVAQSAPSTPAERIIENYGRLPLAFEVNQGQADSRVKFLSQGVGYKLFLTPTEAVLALSDGSQEKSAAFATAVPDSGATGISTFRAEKSVAAIRESVVVRMTLLGANSKAELMGGNELAGRSNYFIGNDPTQWHTNVSRFEKVRYENIYPRTDLVYYGHQQELEYDFVLRPGANLRAIRLGITGARRLRVDHGDLVLTTSTGDVRLRSPRIYQRKNGVRRNVRGHYVVRPGNEVGFRVGAYDRQSTLVIDPVLAYSSYLSNAEAFNGIAVDAAGNAYLTGGPGNCPFEDAFVTKLNNDGSAVLYSVFFRGNGCQVGASVAVDKLGNAYVTGSTSSTDFPTVNAFQSNYAGGGQDGFVAKINAAGTALLYSSYLGGSSWDWGLSIAADSFGRAYVTGMTNSVDFPTFHPFQSTYTGNGFDYDAFVTKLTAAGSRIYSTYLGGNNETEGHGIATDSAGNAYVAGLTLSGDFPTANPIQPTYAGGSSCPQTCGDAFVTKFNASGSALVYSTYLGGSSRDTASGIAVDSGGNAYITGYTYSTDFPAVNAIQPNLSNGASTDAFVSKINASGSALVYSTYLGGSKSETSASIAVDSAGNAYITGQTSSADFPTVKAIQPGIRAGADAFVSELNAAGSALVYSTYLGGNHLDLGSAIAVDLAGSAYVTGETNSSSKFPITPLAFQQSPSFGFVTKIAQRTFVSVSPTSLGLGTGVLGSTSSVKNVTMTNAGSEALKINRIYIGGLDTSDFGETNNCGSALMAGESCIASITFKPTAKNKRTAVLGMSDSDSASPQTAVLTGTGTVVSLSSKNLSFGSQLVSTMSAPKNIKVTNVGNTQLNFTGFAITGTNAGDFSQKNTCGMMIAAEATCMITVKFTPTAQGTRKATIIINDDGGASPQKITLGGVGT